MDVGGLSVSGIGIGGPKGSSKEKAVPNIFRLA
jgi:hypothetical protein